MMAVKPKSAIALGKNVWAAALGVVALGVGAASVVGAGLFTPSAASAASPAWAASVPAPSTSVPTHVGAASAEVSSTARQGVLSGQRRVTITRAGAFESGVALTRQRLIEADDDTGRQLFVPTPLGKGQYLIKAYQNITSEPTCWQVHQPGTTASLIVRSATCDSRDPDQRFTIERVKGKGYAFGNTSAYLQTFNAGDLHGRTR